MEAVSVSGPAAKNSFERPYVSSICRMMAWRFGWRPIKSLQRQMSISREVDLTSAMLVKYSQL